MFKKKKKQDVVEIQNWYKDRHQWLSISRNLMVVVSLLCLSISLLCAGFIYSILPYKSVEPFVIQIDQKSGITERVNQVSAREMMANEALKKYFVVKYIRSRESLVEGGWQSRHNYLNYLTASYMTKAGTKALAEYNKLVSPANTDSYFNRLGANGTRTVTIKNITFEGANSVSVRAYVEETGNAAKKMHLTINLEFEFVKLDMTPEQSYINPLGFLVNTYRVIEEVVNE